MAGVKVTELDDLIVKVLAQSDHPEIEEIEVVPTLDRPDNHTRIVVKFVSGRTAIVMVRQVSGQSGRRHTNYELPQEVLR